MPISQKRAPSIKDSVLNRVVQDIYSVLNEIINSVNQGKTTSEKKTTEGKSGDLRIIKDSAGDYYLEAKTDEGWIRSDNSSTGFSFRDRD